MLSLPELGRYEPASPERDWTERDWTERATYSELASGQIELNRLWHLLTIGRLKIVGTFSVADRSFAELASASGETALPLDTLLLERILEGECPKALAAEVGMSTSYLSTRCAGILARIGCESSVSRTAPVVAMAVFAARGVPLERASVDIFSRDGSSQWMVSVTNPVVSVRGLLTPCEYDVARYSIDGKRLSEIASLRGTSERTVANQLASIFRKLNVSGRAALRALAIRTQGKLRVQ